MRLSEVLSDFVTIPIEINDDILHVTYSPKLLTPDLEDSLKAVSEQQGNGAWLAGYLSGLIAQWDLEDEKGNAVLLDEKVLRTLPTLFLNAVAEAIAEDINPKKGRGSRSNGSFARKG